MRYKTLLIAVLATFSMALAIAQSRETGNDLFQKALDLERGQGDLDAAIQIYQQIVREFPADKPVAARALFRLGYCQELIGQAQSRKSYEQLVRDYGDQKTVADDARARLAVLTGAEPAPRGPAIAIAEMDPRTGTIRGPVQLITQGTTYRDQYPTWSPDGKSVAFNRTMNRGDKPTTAVVVLNLAAQAETAGVSTDGGVRNARERILDEDGTIGPSFWLPAGEGALASMEALSLIRHDPDGRSSVIVNLILRPHDVALAPDGKTLYAHVLTQNPALLTSTISVIDVATGERKDAFSLPAGSAAEDDIRDLGNYLSVSPDGSELAIVRWSGKRQPLIGRWGVDGSNKGETPAGSGFVQRVQWARDGRSIFFAMSQNGTRWRIMRLAVDGVSPTFTGLEVTNLTYFDLSPDGARIAFDGTAYTVAAPGPSVPR